MDERLRRKYVEIVRGMKSGILPHCNYPWNDWDYAYDHVPDLLEFGKG